MYNELSTEQLTDLRSGIAAKLSELPVIIYDLRTKISQLKDEIPRLHKDLLMHSTINATGVEAYQSKKSHDTALKAKAEYQRRLDTALSEVCGLQLAERELGNVLSDRQRDRAIKLKRGVENILFEQADQIYTDAIEALSKFYVLVSAKENSQVGFLPLDRAVMMKLNGETSEVIKKAQEWRRELESTISRSEEKQ